MMNRNNIALYGIIERQRLNSIKKELFRKSIHICASFTPLLFYVAKTPSVILLASVLIIYIICEILRLKGYQVPLVSKITETAARKRDENKFVLGPVTLVCGILISAIFFPLQNATFGIFALAFGDGFASLVGKLIGKVSIPGSHGKTVAGSLACFFAVFCAAFVFGKNCTVAFILAFCSMLLEILPLSDFDNILIPVSISAISMLLV